MTFEVCSAASDYMLPELPYLLLPLVNDLDAPVNPALGATSRGADDTCRPLAKAELQTIW